MIIKYDLIAKKYETVESKRNGDRYVAAKTKTDNFRNYFTIPVVVLENAGFNSEECRIYSREPSRVPTHRRDIIVEHMRKYIIEHFEETNNYYRELNGLPNIEDEEEVWLDFDVYEKYNIEPEAVHKLDYDDILKLEIYHELDEVRQKYPDKLYLNHLGEYKIDITTARLADNFQILYFPRLSSQDTFYNDFINNYEQCREYFLTVIYNKYYSGKYNMYDNYIAFNILIMTVNRIISGSLLRFKEREFYDTAIMKIFLDSYGITVADTFNAQQLRFLCKNINILLQSKSTNKVFIDILSILGYGNISAKKYYLFKQHKMNPDGTPLFVYKTDEDGNPTNELDKSKMYDLYFLHSDIDSYNVRDIIYDEKNKLSYDSITNPDPYWVEDEDLKNKIYSSDFNYIETKYVDFDVIYRMQQVIFDTVYLTRLVLDTPETKAITTAMSKITPDKVSIFDMFILLICMMCKFYNIKPSILKTTSKLLYIQNFDFDDDLDAIRRDIESVTDSTTRTHTNKIQGFNTGANLSEVRQFIRDNKHVDKTLLNYINTLYLKNTDSINKMFTNVKELRRAILDRMMSCETIDAYKAYDKLYRTLMITDVNNSIYNYTIDTEVYSPDTYDEYLKANNITLYNYYNNLQNRDEISVGIDYITDRLTTLFQSAQYMNRVKILDTTQIHNIIKLLSFFKSYTVMVKDMNVLLMLDDKYFNNVHITSSMSMGSGDGATKLSLRDGSMIDFVYDKICEELASVKVDENIGDMDDYAIIGHDMHTDEDANIDMSSKKISTAGEINMDVSSFGRIQINPEVNMSSRQNIGDIVADSNSTINTSTKCGVKESLRFIYE
jgi:hypothetical protein